MPESGASQFWSGVIWNGVVAVGIDVKEGFIAASRLFFSSPEYIVRNKTNSAFVVDLYQTFLNRVAGQSEIDYWVSVLDGGLSRNVVLNYFSYSAEFSQYTGRIFGTDIKRPEPNLVNDFYRGFFNRLPDTESFNNYLSLMRTAQCIGLQQVRDVCTQISLNFIRSSEYTNRNRNNTEFVEDLYNGILRRGAQIGEINYWKGLLNNNTYNREQILDFFLNSAEFTIKLQSVVDAGCYEN